MSEKNESTDHRVEKKYAENSLGKITRNKLVRNVCKVADTVSFSSLSDGNLVDRSLANEKVPPLLSPCSLLFSDFLMSKTYESLYRSVKTAKENKRERKRAHTRIFCCNVKSRNRRMKHNPVIPRCYQVETSHFLFSAYEHLILRDPRDLCVRHKREYVHLRAIPSSFFSPFPPAHFLSSPQRRPSAIFPSYLIAAHFCAHFLCLLCLFLRS